MISEWNETQIAGAAGGKLYCETGNKLGPKRVVIDSRQIAPGDLFVGLPGSNVNGATFAEMALDLGAWGVLVQHEYAQQVSQAKCEGKEQAAIIGVLDPLAALGLLAKRWREHLPAKVIGVTGSVGKTTTKDLIVTLAKPYCRVWASQENFNTEIGLPLSILAASADTELLILEMAMRGPGQIAELTEIAQPDVGVITCIAPVHLELLGSIEAIAKAKAELITHLPHGAVAVVPVDEPLLTPYLTGQNSFHRFGVGGDVETLSGINLGDLSAHLQIDALAAVAALRAVGIQPQGEFTLERSALREEEIQLPNDTVLINDCYNSSPVSLVSALRELVRKAQGRKIAVLGDMLELGAQEEHYHHEVGLLLNELQIDFLVTVGRRAKSIASSFAGRSFSFEESQPVAAYLGTLFQPGDTVLVKGSRGMKMEVIAQQLQKEQQDG